MPDHIRFSNPDTMQKPPGYNHVVEVTGPGRTVYFAGQFGIDKSGKIDMNRHPKNTDHRPKKVQTATPP